MGLSGLGAFAEATFRRIIHPTFDAMAATATHPGAKRHIVTSRKVRSWRTVKTI